MKGKSQGIKTLKGLLYEASLYMNDLKLNIKLNYCILSYCLLKKDNNLILALSDCQNSSFGLLLPHFSSKVSMLLMEVESLGC